MMKSLVFFSTLLVTMGITIPVKAQTPPRECNRNNTKYAYYQGYHIADISARVDIPPPDSWQDVYNKYPPGQGSYANVDTEPEVQCYIKGLQNGFDAGQN